MKLMRKLNGRNVQVTHGLANSLEQLEREPEEFRARVAEGYERVTKRKPEIYITTAANGAEEISHG